MRFLSLFAGIGGFDLGLERAKWKCVGQVEIEPFCQKVLAKHWPNVWRWNDVKTLTGEIVKEQCGTIDLLCGGVPCQPASVAGKRLGTADDRWLWPEFLRLVSEVNPVWVLAENPRGVLSIDVDGVQFGEWLAREFAARGYELFPVELAAEDVGAPHRRERIFFVAVADSRRSGSSTGNAFHEGRPTGNYRRTGIQASTGWPLSSAIGDAESASGDGQRELGNAAQLFSNGSGHNGRSNQESAGQVPKSGNPNSNDDVADVYSGRGRAFRADDARRRPSEETRGDGIRASELADAAGDHVGNDGFRSTGPESAERRTVGERSGSVQAGTDCCLAGTVWPSRPGQPQHEWEEPRTVELQMGESASGLSVRLVRRHRVSALKALGNAIVPQCAEVIGRAIMQMELK